MEVREIVSDSWVIGYEFIEKFRFFNGGSHWL